MQHFHSFCYKEKLSRILTHNIRILIYEFRKFFGAFGGTFIKSWLLYSFFKWFHIREAEQITDFLPSFEVL